jgi:hypothetical protein
MHIAHCVDALARRQASGRLDEIDHERTN